MTSEEMERTLIRLAALQENSQHLLHQTLQAMGKMNDLVVSFAVDMQASVRHTQSSIDRLEARIEQFAEQQNASLLRLVHRPISAC